MLNKRYFICNANTMKEASRMFYSLSRPNSVVLKNDITKYLFNWNLNLKKNQCYTMITDQHLVLIHKDTKGISGFDTLYPTLSEFNDKKDMINNLFDGKKETFMSCQTLDLIPSDWQEVTTVYLKAEGWDIN